MFSKTDQAGRQVSAPPNTPQILAFKSGPTLWSALFADVSPSKQPPFVVVFVEGNVVEVSEALDTKTANLEALTSPVIQEVVIVPLLARLRDKYTDGTHAIIARNGRVWASDKQDAITAVYTGRPPDDPNEIRLGVPPFLDRCWSFARLFATSRDPRVKAIGLIVLLGVLVLLAGALVAWVFAVYMLGEAIATVLKTIIPTHIAVYMLASACISAFEIVGVFIPPLRPYAYATSIADFILHAWYGGTIGIERADPELIQAIWTILFGVLSFAPEYAIILFVGMAYYLFPILWRWLPKQFARIGRDGWLAWKEPLDDYIEGDWTYEDTRPDGRRVTRRLNG